MKYMGGCAYVIGKYTLNICNVTPGTWASVDFGIYSGVLELTPTDTKWQLDRLRIPYLKLRGCKCFRVWFFRFWNICLTLWVLCRPFWHFQQYLYPTEQKISKRTPQWVMHVGLSPVERAAGKPLLGRSACTPAISWPSVGVPTEGSCCVRTKDISGRVWWLMPETPALWEAKVRGLLEFRGSRPVWTTQWDSVSTKKNQN